MADNSSLFHGHFVSEDLSRVEGKSTSPFPVASVECHFDATFSTPPHRKMRFGHGSLKILYTIGVKENTRAVWLRHLLRILPPFSGERG